MEPGDSLNLTGRTKCCADSRGDGEQPMRRHGEEEGEGAIPAAFTNSHLRFVVSGYFHLSCAAGFFARDARSKPPLSTIVPYRTSIIRNFLRRLRVFRQRSFESKKLHQWGAWPSKLQTMCNPHSFFDISKIWCPIWPSG